MKPWILSLAAVVLGVAVGIGVTWSSFAGARSLYPSEGPAPNNSLHVLNPGQQQGLPLAVVEGIPRTENMYRYDFGAMEMGGSKEHTITVQNHGAAPLTLEKGHFTCTCTLAQFGEGDPEAERVEIPPGGSTEITFKWTPKDFSDLFSTEGDLQTNDPANPVLHFVISGKVVTGVRVSPEDLVLDAISASEPHTATFTIYDFNKTSLEVAEHQLDQAATASYFDVSYQKLPEQEVAKEAGAKAAVEVTVTVKPGLPLGPINQKILINLDREEFKAIEVPIRGRVVGDITFIGPGYNTERGYLSLGTVSGADGASRTVHVMIKGPRRHEMELKIGRIRPEGLLQGALGEARSINDGKVVMIPLEIKIPPGSPTADHLGTQPGTLGLIELESAGTGAEKAILYVRFFVENSK